MSAETKPFDRKSPCEKSPRGKHLMEETNVRRNPVKRWEGVMDEVCKYCGGTIKDTKFIDL